MKTLQHRLKRFGILAIVLTGMLGAHYVATHYFITPQSTTQETRVLVGTTDIEQEYQEQFAQKEAELWDELARTENLTKEYCLHEQRRRSKSYKTMIEDAQKKTAGTPLSAKTEKLVKNILKDFDVTDIVILPHNQNSSPAFADDHTIWINEDELNTLTPKAQKYIIGHELGHVIHKDHSLDCVLNECVKSDAFLDKFSRFVESRADATAMTKGPDYAQGAVEYFNREIQVYGENPGISHPKSSERIHTGKEILAQLNNAQKNVA